MISSTSRRPWHTFAPVPPNDSLLRWPDLDSPKTPSTDSGSPPSTWRQRDPMDEVQAENWYHSRGDRSRGSDLTRTSSIKLDTFQLWQPVTVALPSKSQSSPPRLRPAIVVEREDDFTYAVRLLPKSYSRDESQYYRWHWYRGNRSVAIQAGRKAHMDPDSDWVLLSGISYERMDRAS